MPNLPEAKPVLELIRQNLLDTVSAVSPATGYTVNVIGVEPARLGEPTTDGASVTVEVMLGESDYKDYQNSNVIEWVQEFLFVATCTVVEDSTVSADQLVIYVRSDIEKALDADYTRGNLAHDTVPTPPEWYRRAQGEHEGVVVRRFVRYRTNYNDPYVVR
jgi:hypothetical protein